MEKPPAPATRHDQDQTMRPDASATQAASPEAAPATRHDQDQTTRPDASATQAASPEAAGKSRAQSVKRTRLTKITGVPLAKGITIAELKESGIVESTGAR
jgi:hypothetical protein